MQIDRELSELLAQTSIRRHKNAAARRQSAIQMIKCLLSAEGVIDSHRKEYLGRFLFKLTEAEFMNKRCLRYCSIAAINAPKKSLKHEHVFRRKLIVRDLLTGNQDVERVLSRAVACVVTKSEHDRLDKVDREHELDGWARYARADIQVIDMDTRSLCDLSVM